MFVTASNESEIEPAFAAVKELRTDALVFVNNVVFSRRTPEVVVLAARHTVPTIYWGRFYAEAGGLIAYGSNFPAMYRPEGDLCGKDSQPRQVRRSSGAAAGQVRAGHQPENRRGARPHRAGLAPRWRRRGDRMRRRALLGPAASAAALRAIGCCNAAAEAVVVRHSVY